MIDETPQVSRPDSALSSERGWALLRRSRKQAQGTEILCEYVFRPLAHLVEIGRAHV